MLSALDNPRRREARKRCRLRSRMGKHSSLRAGSRPATRGAHLRLDQSHVPTPGTAPAAGANVHSPPCAEGSCSRNPRPCGGGSIVVLGAQCWPRAATKRWNEVAPPPLPQEESPRPAERPSCVGGTRGGLAALRRRWGREGGRCVGRSQLGRGILEGDEAGLLAGALPGRTGVGQQRAVGLRPRLLLVILHARPGRLVLHTLQPLVQGLQGQLPAGQGRMGRLTPGPTGRAGVNGSAPRGSVRGHPLASSRQERVDSAVLETTQSTWDCPAETHSGSQTTYAEFLCHVVRSEAVRQHTGRLGNGGRKA